MPPRGVKSPKRARQYEHIKESASKQGRSPRRAKQIAAATVNKQRSQSGETKGSRKRSGTRKKSSSASRKSSSRSSTSRKSSSRKSSSRKSSSSRSSSRKKR
jgi:hypothetical protein